MTQIELDSLTSQLLALPVEHRLTLGERLIESVEPFAKEGVDEGWSDELKLRIGEIENGQVECISSEDVHAEVRRRIASP